MQGARQTRPPRSIAVQRKGSLPMNGQTDQRTLLLLLAGCGTVYAAHEHPSFGTALLVGIGVVTLLHLLMRDQ